MGIIRRAATGLLQFSGLVYWYSGVQVQVPSTKVLVYWYSVQVTIHRYSVHVNYTVTVYRCSLHTVQEGGDYRLLTGADL